MGRSDVPLNSRGRAQATAIAEAVRDLSPSRLLASPQRRAVETAEAIARACDRPLHTEPALAEVWLGRWQGKRWDEVRDDPEIARYVADPTYVCDAAEPGVEVQRRMVAFVEELRPAAGDQTIVLVSHGDPLRILMAHYLSMALADYRHLEIAPGSVSVLRLDGRLPHRLCLFNWRPQQQQHQLRW